MKHNIVRAVAVGLLCMAIFGNAVMTVGALPDWNRRYVCVEQCDIHETIVRGVRDTYFPSTFNTPVFFGFPTQGSNGEQNNPDKANDQGQCNWQTLSDLATGEGFTVTSTTGGKHNPGTAHYMGKAIDVRTRDHTTEDVDKFIGVMRNKGFKVADERIQPPKQEVWSGPHIHIQCSANSQGSVGSKTGGRVVVAGSGKTATSEP